jgi:hypothetical protein
MDDPTYVAPELTVLGDVAELTEGSSTGSPDGTDGAASFNL